MRRGSITVFMSLMLTALMIFTLCLGEAVRYGGLRYMARQAGNGAIDSLFAGYDRKLSDEYGLLFFDGSYGKGLISDEDIVSEFTDYFELNAANERLLFGGSFFRLSSPEAVVTDIVAATDYRGEIFIRSALDYYKFEEAANLLSEIGEDLGQVEEGDRAKEQKDREVEESQGLVLPTGSSEETGSSGEESDSGDGTGTGALSQEEYDTKLADSPAGAMRKLKRKGWIQMVIPEGRTISAYQIDTGDFPSLSAVDDRELDSGSIMGNASEKALYDDYLLKHFACFTDEEERTGVQYEIEYILYGEETDEANLRKVLNRLLAMREGLNILHIMRDSSKCNEAFLMATALMGWTGLAPVVELTKAAIIAAWAFAESLIDLRELLSGYSVPVMKSAEDWNLSLENVTGFLRGEEVQGKQSEKGKDYEGYLRLLLYLENFRDCAYRTMDMVQFRMRESNPAFLMASRIFALQIRVNASAPQLLTRLPLARREFPLASLGQYRFTDYFSQVY